MPALVKDADRRAVILRKFYDERHIRTWVALYALTGSVPSDILMAIVLLSMGGFACAELGKRIPIIRNIGAAAIFATFIPCSSPFIICCRTPSSARW